MQVVKIKYNERTRRGSSLPPSQGLCLILCECLNDTPGSDDWLRQLTTDLSMSKPFAVGEVVSTLIAFSSSVGGASTVRQSRHYSDLHA
jgi:hypothetical protein